MSFGPGAESCLRWALGCSAVPGAQRTEGTYFYAERFKKDKVWTRNYDRTHGCSCGWLRLHNKLLVCGKKR